MACLCLMIMRERCILFLMKAKKTLLIVLGLLVMQYLVDTLYIYLYPNVNPLRASLIGLTSLVVLLMLSYFKKGLVNPYHGALSIFSSAFFGALLVQAGALTSKSVLSGIVHVFLLIATYFLIELFRKKSL